MYTSGRVTSCSPDGPPAVYPYEKRRQAARRLPQGYLADPPRPSDAAAGTCGTRGSWPRRTCFRRTSSESGKRARLRFDVVRYRLLGTPTTFALEEAVAAIEAAMARC